jgi:transcriptional regulator with GAF, ATPase, and Fis domain
LDGKVLALAHELAELSRLVEREDVAAALERFVARIVLTVPGCDHAAITVRSHGKVETVAGELPELVQTHGTSGAISEALEFREPRRVEDTVTDQRWPAFNSHLVDHGWRSCLTLPLPTQRSPEAVLTLLSRQPHQFNETAYDIVLLLTLHAGVVFDNVQLFHDSRRLVEQLTTALDTRQRIGQAQGLLMLRFGVDADGGFDLLRRASQNANTKLREVATALISAHETDDFADALTRFGLEPAPA